MTPNRSNKSPASWPPNWSPWPTTARFLKSSISSPPWTARSSRPWHASCRRPVGIAHRRPGQQLGGCTPTSTSNADCRFASTSPARARGAKTTNGRSCARRCRPTAVTSWTAATPNFAVQRRRGRQQLCLSCARQQRLRSRGRTAVVGRSGRGRRHVRRGGAHGPGPAGVGSARPLLRLIFVPPRRTTNGARRAARRGPLRPDVLRIATNLLDVPGEVIGFIYQRRWTIEIFFRFLKHILGCRHLLSTNPAGVEIQAYCAIIACLLIALWTGKQPTKRTYEMLCFYFIGWADEEELLAHLRKTPRPKTPRRRSPPAWPAAFAAAASGLATLLTPHKSHSEPPPRAACVSPLASVTPHSNK